MRNISNALNRISEIALTLFICAMAVVVFFEVIFRYLLLLPLFWTEEFARYCLVWSSLLGAAVALKRGQHIAVSYIVEKLSPKFRWLVALFVDVSIAAMLVVVLWGGVNLVLLTRFQLSPALRISMSLPYLAVPIGAAIMLVHVIAAVVERFRLGLVNQTKAQER